MTEKASLEVEAVSDVDEELAAALGRLVPQLSRSASVPSAERLRAIASATGTTLFVARSKGEAVGMLTLVTYEIPTGLSAVVEDVVVDERTRGTGAGSALLAAAIKEAADRGARHLDLTSRPSREAANRLYQKMGFARRETNVYRHPLR